MKIFKISQNLSISIEFYVFIFLRGCHKAENLRKYIEEVGRRGRIGRSGLADRSDWDGGDLIIPADAGNARDLSKWLVWARQKADWYDQFVEGVDEMMEGVERNSEN